MYDAAAIGEVLIDFTPSGTDGNGFQAFTANPGGAPANVMAALAKWGRKTAFIGKAGMDSFGLFLQETLVKSGVDTEGLVLSDGYPTTLAFVHLNADGDRSFSFYRNPGADMMLSPEEINLDIVEQAGLLHFGSVSLTDEPAREATLHAVREAKRSGKQISFDPNLRPLLWESLDIAKEQIRQGLAYADVVKLSLEELEFLTGTRKLEQGTESLYEEFQIPLILVTLGEDGCFYRIGGEWGSASGYPVQAIDTTGAGDCFFAGFLWGMLELGKTAAELEAGNLPDMLAFANGAGALVTQQKGAIPAIPSIEEIKAFIKA
jgi:fructokinase